MVTVMGPRAKRVSRLWALDDAYVVNVLVSYSYTQEVHLRELERFFLRVFSRVVFAGQISE